MTPLRVLHLCSAQGSSRWLTAMLAEQRARGYDVRVGLSNRGPLWSAVEQLGLAPAFVHLQPTRPDWATVHHLAALTRFIRQTRPDVVHSHHFHANISGRIGGWLADAPIRLSMNIGPLSLESPVMAAVDIGTAHTDTCVIASCEYVRTLYRSMGLAEDRVALAYYGADAAVFDPAAADPESARAALGTPPGTRLVGHVAHFYAPKGPAATTPRALWGKSIKGHDTLLAAWPAVRRAVPDAHLVLVGIGTTPEGETHRRHMQALADRLGIAGTVTFAGSRSDVPDLLAAFEVAVQCSRTENIDGTAEALLMNRPAVVTRVGGMPEVVRDGVTGLVVPPDDPRALADAIVRLLTDRTLARSLADAGRTWALDRFTAKRTADDLGALYQSLAGAPRFGGAPPRRSGYRLSRTYTRLAALPGYYRRLHAMVRTARREAMYEAAQ